MSYISLWHFVFGQTALGKFTNGNRALVRQTLNFIHAQGESQVGAPTPVAALESVLVPFLLANGHFKEE